VVPELQEVTVAADPEGWREGGFRVEGEVCLAGAVRIRLAGAGAGRGLVSWALSGIEAADLDGLPPPVRADVSEPARGERHPNGVIGLDHVVAFSPDLDRTVAALEAAGLDLRRIREGPTPGGAMRQAFFRLGEPLLEVIEAPPDSPLRERPGRGPRLWGLAFLADELDSAARVMGDRLGEPRPAVQEGRRIVSAGRSAGLGAPVAFITPEPRSAPNTLEERPKKETR
jgi:glyoxalase/bleomycin resistance protein/dioxygenase superfamily protein